MLFRSDKAVKMWESIVEAGAYDHTYMELLESLDITTFRDSAAVGVYCDQALSFVESAVGYSGYNYNFNIPDNISDYGDLEDWLKDFMDQFGGFMDGFGGK